MVLGEASSLREEKEEGETWLAGEKVLSPWSSLENLLNDNVGDYTLVRWNGTGVERDLVNFLDHEREIELAKVNTLESTSLGCAIC